MPLSTASILSGATYVTPTGGTALTFAGRGAQNNTHILVDSAATDARTQKSIVCSVKDPKVSAGAPNGYTQARVTVTTKSPKTLANLNITVNTMQTTMATDTETTAAEIAELKLQHIQAIMDADFTALWLNRSLA